MTRRLLSVALLLAALLAADRGLGAREAAMRATALRIGHLFDAAERAGGPLAALRVETGTGESFFYGLKDGAWRCLSWRNAVADGAQVLELAGALMDAVGFPVEPDPGRPADFGLDAATRTRITLHGPKASLLDARRDVLASVDVGRGFSDGSGCYVRRAGERPVWSVDVSPGALLDRGSALRQPPLLDRRMVPAHWPGTSPRVQSVLVERADEAPYELQMQALPVSDSQPDPSRPPFEWVLVRDGRSEPCAALLVLFYLDHLLEARWEGLADQVLAPHLGFDRPRARVTLRSGDAEPLQLVLGARRPGARLVVAGSATGLIYELPVDEEALLFPPREAFAPDATRNPWEQ
jgi:hypothetical protein